MVEVQRRSVIRFIVMENKTPKSIYEELYATLGGNGPGLFENGENGQLSSRLVEKASKMMSEVFDQKLQ